MLVWLSWMIPILPFLARLCQILDRPNEGDPCHLTPFDDLLTYGKIESRFYTAIISIDRNPKTLTHWNDFKVISKWFMGNVITLADQNDYVHPLQSPFLYPFLQIGDQIFVTSNRCVRHTAQSQQNPSYSHEVVSPIWHDSDCCFCPLQCPVYRLLSKDVGAIITLFVKLIQLHKILNTIPAP